MARLMKDRNGRYQIEVARARKFVHCVIKDGCLVRTKKWPLAKFIKNDQADIGEQVYDKWWQPVPETEYPLAKAIDQFLEAGAATGWGITDGAKTVLTALKEQKPVSDSDLGDDEAVTPPASAADEISKGESDMSTKKAKSKKSGNGAAKPRSGACAKVHEIAAKMGRSASRADVIAACVKAGVNKATAATQYQKWKHRND